MHVPKNGTLSFQNIEVGNPKSIPLKHNCLGSVRRKKEKDEPMSSEDEGNHRSILVNSS